MEIAHSVHDESESNFVKLLELCDETDPSILGGLVCILIHVCHTCCYCRCSFCSQMMMNYNVTLFIFKTVIFI